VTLRDVADVWPICPGSGEKPAGWSGWPSDRRFAFILTHDVEQTRGMQRCLQLARMEKELGLVSAFNFVPEKYYLPPQVRDELSRSGFEIGVHDLRHDGKLYSSQKVFLRQALIIIQYLRDWNSVGFRAGSMCHNLKWLHGIRAEYDLSTFDTDPFEPQPDGICTVFPQWIVNTQGNGGCVELPYTLPQDLCLFIIFQHRDTQLWEDKLEWIAIKGGMALLTTHPDYMAWGERSRRLMNTRLSSIASFCIMSKKNTAVSIGTHFRRMWHATQDGILSRSTTPEHSGIPCE